MERKSVSEQAWKNRPSQRLLFSALVFLIVLVLVASFTLASLDSYRRHVRVAEGEVLVKAQWVAAAHEQWLSEARSIMSVIGVGIGRLQDLPRQCQPLLQRYMASLDGLDVLLLLDTRGNLLCSSTPTNRAFNFADRRYFQRVLKQKSFSVGGYIIGRVSGERVLPLATPVWDDKGEMEYVLVAGRKLDWIRDALARQRVSADIELAIVDGDGIVLAQEPEGTRAVETAYPSASLRGAIKLHEQGILSTRMRGMEYLMAYRRLGPPESDVFIVISQPAEQIIEPTLNIMRSNLWQFVVTMLIVIGALWVGLGRWVLRPLQHLADTMGIVRAGKSGMRVEGMGPSREFVSIGENFNDMLYSLEASSDKLKRMAENDALLGIPNRRRLDERLHSEWRRLSRSGEPLSLLMIDVDLFKLYNDHYGHQAGDECLKQVTSVIRSVLNRPADMVARYGGEEFVVLLPETDGRGARRIAASIQQAMQQRHIEHAASNVADYVTLSIGISTVVPTAALHADILIEDADKALYQAKSSGRNRIEAAQS